MKVVLAREMGFCFGVRRAVDVVERAVAERGRLCALGELVHNRQVVERLRDAGVETVHDISEVKDDTVVVATHGAPAAVFDRARARGLNVIDATCPYVRLIQQKARRLSESGFRVVLLGDRGHTEVQGIVGWTRGEVHVVASAGELDEVPKAKKIAFLAQTTQSQAAFEDLVARAVHARLAEVTEISVHNTICNATARRQEAALDLARNCDVVVVVGGRNSANTRRLVDLCVQTGARVHQVEVAGDLAPAWFDGAQVAGVTAGASTPGWVIDEVVKSIENL